MPEYRGGGFQSTSVQTPQRWPLLVMVGLAAALLASLSLNVWVVSRPTQAVWVLPLPQSLGQQRFHALGQTVVSDDGVFDATLVAYEEPVEISANPPETPDRQWGAADVQICARTAAVVVSTGPWHITYVDGEVVHPSGITAESLPGAPYPVSNYSVSPGFCARGWIVFATLKDAQPFALEFAPEGMLPMAWRV